MMVPVIIALGELLKGLRVHKSWLPLINVGLGLLGGLGLYLFQVVPEARGLLQVLFYGLLAGLSAGGLYDLGRHSGGKVLRS